VPETAPWASHHTAFSVLGELLVEIGTFYAPLLLANEQAIKENAPEIHAVIDGYEWRQAVFPYHLKCLAELRRLYAELTPADAAMVDSCLAETGVENLFLPAFS